MEVVEKADQPINHKKILRLMRNFHFFAKIRRANPYRTMAKTTEAHLEVPNYLNRQFNQQEPGKVFLTDITYLQIHAGKTAYESLMDELSHLS